MLKLGSHIFVSKGADIAYRDALQYGYSAVQFFVRNPYKGRDGALASDVLYAYRDLRAVHKIPVFIRSGEYLNIATSDPELVRRNQQYLTEDYFDAIILGADGLVVRPGSHLKYKPQSALNTATKNLATLLAGLRTVPTPIIVETSAGSGTSIGSTFEELGQLLSGLRDPRRVKICLDTSNVFSAGYDISTEDGLEKTLEEFDKHIGLKQLGCIHLNDSDYAIGSRKEAPTRIGEGFIGLDAFERIVNHPELEKVPMLLENIHDRLYAPHPDFLKVRNMHRDNAKEDSGKVIRWYKFPI